MTRSTLLRLSLTCFALAFLVSCAELETRPTAVAPAPAPPAYAWNGDGVPGLPRSSSTSTSSVPIFLKGRSSSASPPSPPASPDSPPRREAIGWLGKTRTISRPGSAITSTSLATWLNPTSIRARIRRPPGSRFDGARMPFAMFFKGGYAMTRVMSRPTPLHTAASVCPPAPPRFSSITRPMARQ